MAGTNTDNSVMQNQPAYSPEGDANFEPSYLQGALTPAPEAKPENVPAPDASSAFAPTQQTGDSQLTQGQQLQNAIQSGSDQAAASTAINLDGGCSWFGRSCWSEAFWCWTSWTALLESCKPNSCKRTTSLDRHSKHSRFAFRLQRMPSVQFS